MRPLPPETATDTLVLAVQGELITLEEHVTRILAGVATVLDTHLDPEIGRLTEVAITVPAAQKDRLIGLVGHTIRDDDGGECRIRRWRPA